MERHAEVEGETLEISSKTHSGSKNGRKGNGDEGKMVDVILSDMSAPWEQTTGFWKKSLSNPYDRMMNTSGINFKDHAGSMVRFYYISSCFTLYGPMSTNRANLCQDLCSAAVQFSWDTLRIGGHLVCKFYQGSEDKQLEAKLKRMFAIVHREKPESSRSVSPRPKQ